MVRYKHRQDRWWGNPKKTRSPFGDLDCPSWARSEGRAAAGGRATEKSGSRIAGAELPFLGSNQDSPDPESVPPGQRFRSTCPETVTYRASVPASLPRNARFCPEKL